MNKFVQLFYGMLFLLTVVIHIQDFSKFFNKNVIIIPYVEYRFEWWMLILHLDWYIKGFSSSAISIFPIMFITMTQSYLNKYVKELA